MGDADVRHCFYVGSVVKAVPEAASAPPPQELSVNVLSNDVSLLDGKISGITVLPDEVADKPVVVFVHGGGATARSFDIPGHS
ncbi:hypothetical protein [Streptomyces sp. NBC_01217]|uniref:hypothetical protein n=1 Tax=Streptomyces sp. NBC_01217 TaxID=2903779 RepID=UPI002E161AFD|nr:hypothetical protein OG507_01715 [Streptomyces sp. NBC_01217]